jgi:hypothetical protein
MFEPEGLLNMRQVLIGSIVALSLFWCGPALADDVEKDNFGRILEAHLWEGVSAVYYLAADSDNLAKHAFAAGFTDEVKEFETAFSAFKHSGHLHGSLEQDVALIEVHWLEFTAIGQAIVEQALKGEKAAAADLAKFWQTADAIDEHLDAIIERGAHPDI